MDISENKDLFEIIFNSAINGIAVMQSVYDSSGNVEDFSVVLLNEFAHKRIGNFDYKGKRYHEVFPMAKGTGMLERLIAVAETGVTAKFEQFFNSGGVSLWVRFTAVKQGDVVVVNTEDITDSKLADAALTSALDKAEKQRRLYDSVTNNTPDLVYVFDLTYRFAYANKALLDMWGKKAEDAIGFGLRENGYEEWHAQLHEREIDKIVATKKSIRGTVSFPHAELGQRVYDYILVPVLNENGEVEAVAGTTRDITDIKRVEEKLKQSEIRLKTMIDQTPAATLVVMGDDLVITQINQTMLQLIGVDEQAVGTPMLSVMPELEGQYIWAQVHKVYEEGVPFDQWEVPVSHKRTGIMEDYYYNIAYRPLIEDGAITGMIQVAIDVTEQVVSRKKLEESERSYKALSETLEQQVHQRTQELERSNEDLQQFAHVASHDLKEPIRKIKMFSSRLLEHLDGKMDQAALDYFDKISVATNRMFTMIDGVLIYSTVNASKEESGPVDLNELLANIETDLEVTLQKKGGTIRYEDLPTIEGAFVLLYQLFYNLINNSIKFAREGVPPEIRITSEILEVDNVGLAHIELRDNGIGFESVLAERIFETFSRLNAKDKYEGTGLGLSLCKKIVERHGGSIKAMGTPDEGATFIIILPLKQEEDGI